MMIFSFVIKRELQGLLKSSNPKPAVAVGIVHAYTTTTEVQTVGIVIVPRTSTRRPIVTTSAKAIEATRLVVTQDR